MEQTIKNVCHVLTYRELFYAHARQVRNFLFYKGASTSEADTLAQEAFLRLWHNCAEVPFDKAKGYVFATADQLLTAEKKQDQAMLPLRPQGQNEESLAGNAHLDQETRELQYRLQKAISQLPEIHRVVFLMNRMDKMKYTEIADILGLDVKEVERLMHLALVELRQRMGSIRDDKATD